MEALGDEAIWVLEQYSELRRTLEGVQASFQPSSYTSETYGYSLTHPPGWSVIERPNYDYYSYDPISGTSNVYVQLLSASGYSSISTYGENHTVIDANITSQQVVFTGRPNPSYRMDYTLTNQTTGRVVRGTALITLAGENAIWVFVADYSENWPKIESLVDDIFLRVAIKR